jgi:hypothetical protein
MNSKCSMIGEVVLAYREVTKACDLQHKVMK